MLRYTDYLNRLHAATKVCKLIPEIWSLQVLGNINVNDDYHIKNISVPLNDDYYFFFVL